LRHLIIGAGVVGYATGRLLEAHNEDVVYYDINQRLLQQLSKKNHITINEIIPEVYSIIWICTPETTLDDIMKKIEKENYTGVIAIRSTTPIGKTEELQKNYAISSIAHVPEFLRAKTSIEDIFNPDRIIIGTHSVIAKKILKNLYERIHPSTPIIVTEPIISETVKLVSNAWLSTQIAFWNDIKTLCETLEIDPQLVADLCTLDRRISKYGTRMTGEKIGGYCLPKDLKHLLDIACGSEVELLKTLLRYVED